SFFFFQAEDGIRDFHVTGVQTCALPISLGLPVVDPDEGGRGRYAVFGPAPGGLHAEVQRVDHSPRVHLDIEADDVEAEVRRLEALGARRIEHVRERLWVMEAPSGQRFCVVPMREDAPRAMPSTWP